MPNFSAGLKLLVFKYRLATGRRTQAAKKKLFSVFGTVDNPKITQR